MHLNIDLQRMIGMACFTLSMLFLLAVITGLIS